MAWIVRAACIGAAAVAVASIGSGTSAAKGSAVLRLVSTTPLTLTGTGFLPRERVRLTVQVGSEHRVRFLDVPRGGTFTARFPSLTGVDRCNVVAVAAGKRGSQAKLKAQPQCRIR